MEKILIIGSLNTDFVINVNKMPKVGETVLGESFELFPGGKGANQAYTGGKLGGNIGMIGAVGKDAYGDMLIQNLKSVNVDTSGIEVVEDAQTGVAFITVNEQGDNSITVVGGANKRLNKEMIQKHISLLEECKIVIMQMEIPVEMVIYIAKIAKKLDKMVILDPAPAPGKLPEEFLHYIDVIKPNETELHSLTGMKTGTMQEVEYAAKKLLRMGVKKVIVTLGEKGALFVDAEKTEFFAAEKVEAVDTTAAGDCFTAAFALSLTNGKSFEEAIVFGNKVSAIAVTRKGAQTSIPEKAEIQQYI